MTSLHLSVTPPTRHRTRLPDWASEFALLVAHLQSTGVLTALPQRLQVPRQGGYSGVDILLFLLAFFCWKGPRSLNKFGEACASCCDALAAVGGRSSWPSPSSVSRFLAAADRCDLDTFGTWLLGTGSGAQALADHAIARARDTLGNPWSVLDFDPSVQAQRQRALPEGPDLPPARRRARTLCAPGYPGRKRGETQFSTGYLISSGSGLWLQATVEPGNCHLPKAAEVMACAAEHMWPQAGPQAQQTVVRIDGGGGHATAVAPFVQRGIHYLVRLVNCALLRQQDISAFLADATWYAVPDSGSGPKRMATELGSWLLQNDDWPANIDLPPARLVVSRFAATEKHGAGIFLGDWQYEVFATDLDAAAWPAPETVELYYGRCGLENRFAQMFKEIGLDHAYSHTPAGQRLVTLAGLWTSNLRTVLGARIVGTLGAPVAQSRRAIHSVAPHIPAVVLPAAPPTPEATPALTLPAIVSPHMSHDEAATLLTAFNWPGFLGRYPGWQWKTGLVCPAGLSTPLQRLRPLTGTLYAIFKQSETACRTCLLRKNCTKSTDPLYTKQVYVPLRRITRTAVTKLADAAHAPQTKPKWQPPPSSFPGPWQTTAAPLIPAVLRHKWLTYAAAIHVDIHHTKLPENHRPDWLADTALDRQRRRKSWRQHDARFASRSPAIMRFHHPHRENTSLFRRVVKSLVL